MADPRIRPATVDDAPAIARLHTASWQTAYRGILPDTLLDAMDLDDRVEKRRRALEAPMHPSIRNWVIETEGRVVGWASTGTARDEDLGGETAELMAIYLDPGCVGQGFGRALMEHCLADTRAVGHREMTMWVLSGNERAQAFYRAAGFEDDPRVPEEEFLATGAHKRRMRRPL